MEYTLVIVATIFFNSLGGGASVHVESLGPYQTKDRCAEAAEIMRGKVDLRERGGLSPVMHRVTAACVPAPNGNGESG